MGFPNKNTSNVITSVVCTTALKMHFYKAELPIVQR